MTTELQADEAVGRRLEELGFRMGEAFFDIEQVRALLASLATLKSKLEAAELSADKWMEQALRELGARERAEMQIATLKSENEQLRGQMVEVSKYNEAVRTETSQFLLDYRAKLAAAEAENEKLRGKVGDLEDRAHYAEGTAKLAMQHRDDAEAQLATARRALRWALSWIEQTDPEFTRSPDYRAAAALLAEKEPNRETIQGEVGREFPNSEKELGT